jgi:hypothetical protein
MVKVVVVEMVVVGRVKAWIGKMRIYISLHICAYKDLPSSYCRKRRCSSEIHMNLYKKESEIYVASSLGLPLHAVSSHCGIAKRGTVHVDLFKTKVMIVLEKQIRVIRKHTGPLCMPDHHWKAGR